MKASLEKLAHVVVVHNKSASHPTVTAIDSLSSWQLMLARKFGLSGSRIPTKLPASVQVK